MISRPAFLVCLPFVLCCFAQQSFAGHYVVTYDVSDCEVQIQGPNVYWTKAYTVGENGVSAEGSGVDPLNPGATGEGPGWAKCKGKIIAKFQWDNEGNPDSEPPLSVLVTKVSQATYWGDTGNASNGQSDPEVAGTSQGTHYSLKVDPGQYFEVACEPTAYGNATMGPGTGMVQISYQVQIQAMKVYMVGTVQDGVGAENALVGNRVHCSMIAEGDLFNETVTFDNETWSIGGDIFKSFVVSNDAETGYVDPMDIADFITPSPQWSWKDKAQKAAVQSYFNVYVNNALIGVGAAKEKVTVHVPVSSMWFETTGVVNYTVGYPTSVVAGGPDIEQVQGITFKGQVETPLLFFIGQGEAEWMFAQLCDLDRKADGMIGGNPAHWKIDTGGYMLDNSWGYSQHFWANNTEFPDSDSPGWPLNPSIVQYHVHDKFKMWLMFRPAGYAQEWVPLRMGEWHWDAVGSRPTAAHPWPEPINGSVQKFDVNETREHPQWDERFSNSWLNGPYPGW